MEKSETTWTANNWRYDGRKRVQPPEVSNAFFVNGRSTENIQSRAFKSEQTLANCLS